MATVSKKFLNKQRSILKLARTAMGLSIAQASKSSKVQQARLQRLEAGQYEIMASECIILEKFYGVEIYMPLLETLMPKSKAKIADSDEGCVIVADQSEIAH
jgi:predicted transcriptional regulator